MKGKIPTIKPALYDVMTKRSGFVKNFVSQGVAVISEDKVMEGMSRLILKTVVFAIKKGNAENFRLVLNKLESEGLLRRIEQADSGNEFQYIALTVYVLAPGSRTIEIDGDYNSILQHILDNSTLNTRHVLTKLYDSPLSVH